VAQPLLVVLRRGERENVSHNTILHRIVRPMVRPLVGTFVTPNLLTSLRMVSGIAAASLFALGEEAWTAAGVVFLLSALLDRADGELARMANLRSPFGHRFDLISDYSSHVLVFIGIGIGLRHDILGHWAILLGLVAGFAIIGIFALVAHVEKVAGTAAAAFPTTGDFDPDDAMLIVAVAAFLDFPLALLVAASIGAPLFLAFSCWRFREYLPIAASVRKPGL
jgi:archaetidylinositol phosphate synthase